MIALLGDLIEGSRSNILDLEGVELANLYTLDNVEVTDSAATSNSF